MSTNRHPVRTRENATWYMALILILVAGVTIWIILSLRTDPFTERLRDDDTLAILIIIDDGTNPILSEVFLYHPVTRNGALVNIPEETGMLLPSIDRMDRLEVLYRPNDTKVYTDAVALLLGKPVDFVIRMHTDEFEKLVDLAGGINVFLPNAIDRTVDGQRYLFPPGSVGFDGAKARSYIVYHPESELPEERGEREHQVVQSLLKELGENSERLISRFVYPYINSAIHGDLDKKGLASFIRELSMVDTGRIVFQSVLGNRRTLEGQIVLFPYYDGKLIKETVQRVSESLARAENSGHALSAIRVEILNGTAVNGLAGRTAEIYRSYGFRIAAVGNAERNDYDKTVVIDRRGNAEATRQVAELIRCKRVHSSFEMGKDETVDVTIILGKDFDGRYAKN